MRDVGREHANRVGSAERRVGEVHHAKVGSTLAHEPGDEREVEVLHQHGVAVAGGLAGRIGERAVDGLVPGPGFAKAGIETRSAGRSNKPWCKNHKMPFEMTS